MSRNKSIETIQNFYINTPWLFFFITSEVNYINIKKLEENGFYCISFYVILFIGIIFFFFVFFPCFFFQSQSQFHLSTLYLLRIEFLNFFNLLFMSWSQTHDQDHKFNKLTKFTQLFFSNWFFFSILLFNIGLIEN